jgi:hypothetical protein
MGEGPIAVLDERGYVYGKDFPGETVHVLKEQEINHLGDAVQRM